MNHRLITALKIGITGLAFFVVAQRVDLTQVWATLTDFPATWIPTIGVLLAMSLAISSLKWKVVLQVLGQQISLFRLIRLFWAGLFFNTFLPGRTGGDAVRAYGLPKSDGSRSRAITSVVVDRGVNLLALVLIGAAATLLDSSLPVGIVWGVRGLAGVCVATIVILFACRKSVHRMLPKGLAEKLSPLLSTKWGATDIALVTGLAFAFQTTMILINVFAARALGIPISTLALFVVIPITALITAIPVSINGVGIREAAYAALLSGSGVTPEYGVALSVTVTAAIICWSMIGGIVFVAASSWKANANGTRPSPLGIGHLGSGSAVR